MAQFTKLFEPGKIGKLELKNRIIFPPMVTFYATKDGFVSEQQLNYYIARARGGCGLIIVESAYPRSGGYPGRIYLDDDRVLPSLRKLVDAMHAEGAKVILQVNPHRGRADEVDSASACENIYPVTGKMSRALSIDDFKRLEREFGEGARRVKEANFDGIMIHGGSGYLVSETLSPLSNRRTDEYGGDIKKRARFALNLIAETKANTGDDFPLIFRLTADEKLENGFEVEEATAVCKLLEEAGADSIDVISGVNYVNFGAYVVPYMYTPRGFNADLAAAIKKEVKIPVSVAGRINDPYLAEEILREGKADFVDLGRTLIADPELPNKVMAGKPEDVRKCVACGRCIESIFKPPIIFMICTVNPAVSREQEYEAGLTPAVKKKKVLVIGGGPGGMEAAAIAAQRGHDVTLWEKDSKLGGVVNLAIVPPKKDELKNIIEYLPHRLEQLKVKVELGKKATPEAVSEFSPDAVILAVGAKPLIPKINGIEKRKVVTFSEALSGEVEVGKNVVVIGGGFVGCETADFLAEKGKKVTVVEILPRLVSEFIKIYADVITAELKEKQIETFTGVKKEEITDRGVDIVDKDGKKISLKADDIVIACGSVADKALFQSLNGKVPEVYEVGDCAEARRIHETVYEGATAAMKI